MKFDPALASPFRLEWLADADPRIADDYARAIAEKAEAILLAARFIAEQKGEADVEVRVWVEAANGPGCVSITWEPGIRAHGFYLLDETLRERLACVVFHDLACVSADGSHGQLADILTAMAETLTAERPPLVDTDSAVDPGVER